jgi:hypothetical protein
MAMAGEARASTPDLATVVAVRVERVSGLPNGGSATAAAAGRWLAGCRFTAMNALGWTIYSATIWQEFASDGFRITYFPPESMSTEAHWGWSLTNASTFQWWVTHPTTAAARGNWTFTQWVRGQPFQSRSGWVMVTIRHTGTWSCSSS